MSGHQKQTSLAIQMIIVAMVALRRDSQHRSVDNSEPFRKSYDFIVIGGGTAGCVVARRLSEKLKADVLLLEAGGPQSFVSDIPGIEETMYLDVPEVNWNYRIAPQKHMARGMAVPGVLPEPKGRVLGGSSTINRMVYTRGNRRDYDNWEATYGADDWNFNSVLPFFIKSENNTDRKLVTQNAEYHGTNGPIGVISDPNLDIFLNQVRQSYNSFGIPTVDVNGPEQWGTAIVQMNIKDGYRSSAANAYIEPNPNPKNLFISLNSYVTKILFDKNGDKLTAVGVEFTKDHQKYFVRANKEVILSAGSYGSPQLLMLSGIGPKDHLSQMGIPVLKDLPVGNNLQDHPQVRFWSPILNNTYVEGFPALSVEQLYQLITERVGPLATSTALHTYLNSKSNPDTHWPNVVIDNRVGMFSTNITELIAPYSRERAQQWAHYFGPYLGQPHLINQVYIRRPRSFGRVRLASANPYDYPIIDPNFYAHKQDFEDVVQTIKFLFYFLQNSKISQNIFLIPKPIPGCNLCTDRPIHECDSYIRCYITQIGEKEHHSCGTCRMGAVDRPDTVVDPRLRVKQVSRLRVCDASIVPRLPNSNSNAFTAMIAEKCAHYISRDI